MYKSQHFPQPAVFCAEYNGRRSTFRSPVSNLDSIQNYHMLETELQKMQISLETDKQGGGGLVSNSGNSIN